MAERLKHLRRSGRLKRISTTVGMTIVLLIGAYFLTGKQSRVAEATVSHPIAQLLYLHGYLGDAATNTEFTRMFNLIYANTGVQATNFLYYQDRADAIGSGCNLNASGQQLPTLPSYVAGMPYYSGPQNTQHYCDSQGDIGHNAVLLDQTIRNLYQGSGGKKVILVGYSMGGETIRAFLSYSTHVGDGVANNMVDSVVLLHAVQQGSWVAAGAPVLSSLGGLVGGISSRLPSPSRPATQQFSPLSSFMKWTDAMSNKLPNIPFYSTWGDESVAVQHCFLPGGRGCVGSVVADLGDLVLLPGTDIPTQTPLTGGERFLPRGYSNTDWEWEESDQINWDPLISPSFETGATAVSLLASPEMHTNYPSDQGSIKIKDCASGNSVTEDTEISNIIINRMLDSTYACDPRFGL
jgi:hypothetical protein